MNISARRLKAIRFAVQRQPWEPRRYIRNGVEGIALVPVIETILDEPVHRIGNRRELVR
ncbi:MAG: hypothetical protein H7833_17205 [Magnetococcus sp. DMHC-1]|nr:hypothetical protein [Magnetococcales bacterium]